MRLENELTVAAPPERVWEALLDVPRVVRALPGATVEPTGDAGLYRGAIAVKLGPVSMRYEGTARLQEADEDRRVAVFHVVGRETRGHGTASATITNRVEAADGATRVRVETDLNVSGRAAQLGRGLMEDVSARMLADFARGLERELAGEPEAREKPRAEAEVLDLGGAAWGAVARRFALPGLIAAGLAFVLYMRRRVFLIVVVKR